MESTLSPTRKSLLQLDVSELWIWVISESSPQEPSPSLSVCGFISMEEANYAGNITNGMERKQKSLPKKCNHRAGARSPSLHNHSSQRIAERVRMDSRILERARMGSTMLERVRMDSIILEMVKMNSIIPERVRMDSIILERVRMLILPGSLKISEKAGQETVSKLNPSFSCNSLPFWM